MNETHSMCKLTFKGERKKYLTHAIISCHTCSVCPQICLDCHHFDIRKKSLNAMIDLLNIWPMVNLTHTKTGTNKHKHTEHAEYILMTTNTKRKKEGGRKKPTKTLRANKSKL